MPFAYCTKTLLAINTTISFIVPTYNTPKELLRQCVDSILALPLSPEQRQVIVVDDGSTVPVEPLDGVTLLRQANGGLSAARNAGLEVACGDWVQFVDSDDCLLPEGWSELVSYLSDPTLDVIRFGVESDTSEVRFTTAHHHLVNENLQAAVWRYVFRRSVLGDLRFKPGVLHEDEDFTPNMLLRAGRMLVVGRRCYYYRRRTGSIMNHRDRDHIIKRLDDLEQIICGLQQRSEALLARRVAQLTMDYVYNSLRLEHSLESTSRRVARLREASLWPLPLLRATWKYDLFRLFSILLQ